MLWVGREPKAHPTPAVGRDTFQRPGCSKPHPGWPGKLPGRDERCVSSPRGGTAQHHGSLLTLISPTQAGSHCRAERGSSSLGKQPLIPGQNKPFTAIYTAHNNSGKIPAPAQESLGWSHCWRSSPRTAPPALARPPSHQKASI